MTIPSRSNTVLRFFLIAGMLLAAPWPAPSAVIQVPAEASLQDAIDSAHGGDVIELTPGATYVGNFVLPRKTGDRFITIRTARRDGMPAAGHRVLPVHAPKLAKLQSPNGSPVVRTQPGAHHWRLELLELLPTVGGAGDIVTLGDGGSAQTELTQVPHDLIIDRCYIHGDPELGQKRGIALNAGATTIIGSYVADIKAVGQDTQAIGGWNGPGPYRIENNYLEAAGENFMLGGATPAIRDLVPADVVFTRNHVKKPEAWRSKKWTVKNLLELKNARRVLIESNLFEYNWSGAQSGYAIVLTPRGERGRAPWATVEHVTFRLNVVRHVAAGINLLGHDDAGPSGLARHMQITDNLFYDVSREHWGGNGTFLLIGQGPRDIAVERNTIIHSGNLVTAYGVERGEPVPARGFIFRDNLTLHNKYGVHGQGRAVGNDSLDAFFPDGLFSHNVLAGGKASSYPPTNLFPSVAEFQRNFIGYAAENFRLQSDSPYRTAASKGGALGADVDKLMRLIADVQSGTAVLGRRPRRTPE